MGRGKRGGLFTQFERRQCHINRDEEARILGHKFRILDGHKQFAMWNCECWANKIYDERVLRIFPRNRGEWEWLESVTAVAILYCVSFHPKIRKIKSLHRDNQEKFDKINHYETPCFDICSGHSSFVLKTFCQDFGNNTAGDSISRACALGCRWFIAETPSWSSSIEIQR